MKMLGKSLAIGIGAIACVAIGAMIGGAGNVRWKGAAEINSVELVTIVLSALSVMLALLTIFLAVFGVIGWTSINERLREHSLNYFSNELQEGKPAFTMVKKAVQDVIYEGVSPVGPDEIFEDDAVQGGAEK